MQNTVHDYWSIWRQFVLHGVMQEGVLHPSLLQSWRRCAALGLDPYSDKATNDVSELLPLRDGYEMTLLVYVSLPIQGKL